MITTNTRTKMQQTLPPYVLLYWIGAFVFSSFLLVCFIFIFILFVFLFVCLFFFVFFFVLLVKCPLNWVENLTTGSSLDNWTPNPACGLFYTPTVSLQRGETPPPNKCPESDTKQSDHESPLMLDLWRMWSTPSLPLLPGPIWLGVLAFDRVLSMGQIELFDI